MTGTLAPSQPTQRRLAGTPFVGLVPYGEGDAAFFFGRDEEKEIVGGNLRAARLTILYGGSGVGKSSLLYAGVVHDLHEQVRASAAARSARMPFAICAFSSWRDDPLPPLAEAMRAACVEALGGEELPPWQPGEPLVEAVRVWTERVRPLLVVLDQFEDYFLYHAVEDGEGTFAVEFPRLVNEPNLHVNFVLSLREDAWAKLDRFEGRIPTLFANYVRVDHLDRKAAREAIDGPVREWNRRLPAGEEPYEVEPALAKKVIEAAAAGRLGLTESGDGAAPEAVNADGVEAPFLQLVLERLWRATVEAGAHTLDLARLESLGGAQQIVENHLLEALGKLTPAEQAVAADLFRYLVTRSKTKIAHPATDLAEWTGRPEPEVTAVLDKLCRGESGRILRSVSPPAGETAVSYELFHDVLAEPILDWRKQYEQQREQEAEAQRQRAIRRRFVRIGAVLIALVAVFAGLAVWALKKSNDAARATASATSLALASTSNDQLKTHFDVSLLLSLEADRARETVQAKRSMISALEAARSSGAEAILRGHHHRVFAVAFSPDGKTLASAGGDGTVVLWDTKTGSQRGGQPLKGKQGAVNGVAFSPDGKTLASAGNDGTVVLWDTKTRSQLGQPLNGKQGRVFGVAFSPDGTLASAGGYINNFEGTVVLWDAKTRSQRGQPLNGKQGAVIGVAFSPDGKTLASAGFDGTVVLWDTKTRSQLGQPLDGKQGAVNGVAFSPDGKTLASAGNDGTVVLWDTKTRSQRGQPLNGKQGPVHAVAFSPDGKTLASAGEKGTVVLWDTKTRSQLGQPLDGKQGAVNGVAFSPDGKTLASAGNDGTVVLWDTKTRSQLGQPLNGKQGRVFGVAFSPDGKTLASAGGDGTVVLWDTKTGSRRGQPLDGKQGRVFGVAFSPDGKTLASAGEKGTVVLWDTKTGSQRGQPLNGKQGAVNGVAFSPDGKTLASAGGYPGRFTGTVVLWDTKTGSRRGQPLNGKQGPVDAVAFSPDGKTLASAGEKGTVVLWDTKTGSQRGQPLNGKQSAVFDVAFSPDGKTLASAGLDGTVVLWDTKTGSQRGQPLNGKQGAVTGVAFSPDGKTLASAGGYPGRFTGTVVLWDTKTGSQLGQPLNGKQGAVISVAFSPDGKTLASAGEKGTVVLWEGILWSDDPKYLVRQVCHYVRGNLTKAEWETVAPGLPYRTTCPD